MPEPERAFFWDTSTKSWRKALLGEPGAYVWNSTTNAWTKGTIGAEYVWDQTTKSWVFGPGGQYVWSQSSRSWEFVTSSGYGGRYYRDTMNNQWVPNTGFASDSAALIARMTTAPTITRANQINTLISSLKTAGVWDKLDILYVLAAADAQAALLNWKGNASYDLTAVNSPTFTADRGYAGNGTSSYLNTSYTLAAGYQNDNHMGAWSRTDASSTAVDMGVADTFLRTRDASSFATRNMSTASTETVANASSVGHFLVSRTAAAGYDRYKNGASVGAATRTSSTPSANAIFIGARNASGADSFSSRQIAAASAGAGLNATQALALYTALNTYLTAVGAA